MIEEEPPMPIVLNDDTAFVLVCTGCTALLGEFAEFPREGDGRVLAYLLSGSHRVQSGDCIETEVVDVEVPHDSIRTNRI